MKILIVDDESHLRMLIQQTLEELEDEGVELLTATNGEEALDTIRAEEPNLVFLDVMMPKLDGMGLMRQLRAEGNLPPTIVLTAFASIDVAISAVHELGAFWFLEKPVQSGVMRTLLERAIQQNQLIEETQRLNRQLSYRGVLDELVGESPSMKEVFSLIQQVAPTTASG